MSVIIHHRQAPYDVNKKYQTRANKPKIDMHYCYSANKIPTGVRIPCINFHLISIPCMLFTIIGMLYVSY